MNSDYAISTACQSFCFQSICCPKSWCSMGSKKELISQFAEEVCDFSSQYGSESSRSYTVPNIVGPTAIHPKYGDFTQAAVLRTYGPWWKRAPSALPSFRRTPDSFISDDFIELYFKHKVYPTQVDIFETYNPGAVVKILACHIPFSADNGPIRWEILWSGQPEAAPAEPRRFSPPIKPVSFKTNVIRLEFNQSLCSYYTELDAVRLHGIKVTEGEETTSCQVSVSMPSSTIKEETESITKELAGLHFTDGLSAALEFSNNGHFDELPEEVIQCILGYLDIQTLCNLAATSRLFHKHSYDPMQFTELNLQPYWASISDTTLEALQSRCRHLKRLNLSWCGSYNSISKSGINRILQVCSKELTCLQLGCCNFVNADVLALIVQECPQLQELDLQSNQQLNGTDYLNLRELKSLVRLNLYRTGIQGGSLCAILKNNLKLQYLNIGSCRLIAEFNHVAECLGNYCKDLKAVDFWRARTLSHIGLNFITSNCPDLEEIDLGWCCNLYSDTNCFVDLATNCRKIKKIFFTANRTICDNDLIAFATYLSDLEQLDVLGTREVSAYAIERVLDMCKKLAFFDVSFCSGVDFMHVKGWKQAYPHVSIQKSFQN